MKKCSRCKEVKELTGFTKDSRKPSGHSSWCKTCKAQYRKQYYAKNRERELAGIAAYYRAHQDKLRGLRTERRRRDPEKARQMDKRSREKNYAKAQARWQSEEQKAKERARAKLRRQKNPEKERERIRRQQAERWYGGRRKAVRYDRVYERDGGICYLCYLCYRPVDRQGAHFDHVIPLARGGHTYENIRTTHARCNVRKGAKILEPGTFADSP